MLEYNADTPFLLLESDTIQKEWVLKKFQLNYNYQSRFTSDLPNKWQSNYIYDALSWGLARIAKTCSTKNAYTSDYIGILVDDDDDESWAQMKHL